MIITIHIDPSWAAHPGPLSRLLAHVAALEAPAPWTPPATREPGQDEDDGLAELLDGLDAPEPASAPTPKPQPPAARPAPQAFDGPPTTGRQLYRWATFTKALPAVNRLGKQYGHARLVSDWSDTEVSRVYQELTAEPAADGRIR
jgi:hypothetical protein